MQYPLNIKFKIAAIASQIYAVDASDTQVFYVKQKLFKLKENIEIYRDKSKAELIYTVKADRIIDFSPEFTLTDSSGTVAGSVKRLGRKSIWKSAYELKIGNNLQLNVNESNPWVKVIDAFMSEIPILGLVSGYIFHPQYNVTDTTSGSSVALLKKMPAFLQGSYSIENTGNHFDENTNQVFAALMMVVVLRERFRG